MALLLRVCATLALLSNVFGQPQSAQSNVDPAWQRLREAAQYVLSARSNSWNSLEVRNGRPTVITFVEDVANLSVACLPNNNIWLVALSADDYDANVEFEPIPDDFYNGGTDLVCPEDGATTCLPQMNAKIYQTFIDQEENLKAAIDACAEGNPQLMTATGALTGSGTYAAITALWISQTFSGSTVRLITFDSAWANIQVDQSFVRVINKQIDFNNNSPRPFSWYTGAIEISSAPTELVKNSCPGNILCKVTDYVDLACELYNPLALVNEVPSVIVLASGTYRAAILWFEPVGTAVFAFADLSNLYSSWVTEAQQSFPLTTPFFSQEFINLDPALWEPTFANIQQNIGGVPEVFSQFGEPWQSLNNAYNSQYLCRGLFDCFNRLAGRIDPVNVVCTGHALGGAYASICGPWASVAFPSSTIQVVTAGAPAVIGNNFFYIAQNLAVGNPYQVVNGQDPLPRYPSCLSGTTLSLPGGLYINGTTLLMQRLDPLANLFATCNVEDVVLKDQECSFYANALRQIRDINVNLTTPPAGTNIPFSVAVLQ